MKKVLEKLIEDYGLCILEDPDRLSQFLEARNPGESAANFRLTFALRYMIKSGWSVNSKISNKIETHFSAKLSEHLGFTHEEAEDVLLTMRHVKGKSVQSADLKRKDLMIWLQGLEI